MLVKLWGALRIPSDEAGGQCTSWHLMQTYSPKIMIAGRSTLALQDRAATGHTRQRGDAGWRRMHAPQSPSHWPPRAQGFMKSRSQWRLDKLESPAGKQPAGAQPVHQPVPCEACTLLTSQGGPLATHQPGQAWSGCLQACPDHWAPDA